MDGFESLYVREVETLRVEIMLGLGTANPRRTRILRTRHERKEQIPPLRTHPPPPAHHMGRYHLIPGVWRGVEANPIVIYRHLIRQVGVIHDDVSRNFLKRHVRERFEEGRLDVDKRLTQHLREARHAVTFLKKANLGYPKPLTKVLELGWGRRGKRRHELLTVGSLLSTAQ